MLDYFRSRADRRLNSGAAAGSRRRWTAGRALALALLALSMQALSMLALAACAPSASAPEPQNTTAAGPTDTAATAASAGHRKAGSATLGDADPVCTKATRATIGESTSSGAGGAFSFSPRRLTIQRGGFLAVTNTSSQVHALVSTPSAGIVHSVIDLNERQVIQFPKAGTFTIKSADAARRAVLRVTVSGESGCGRTKPTLTIVDGYAFSPTKITLAATANFAVVNKSGTAQAVKCTPDPGGNGDNSRLEKGETQLLAIDHPGRYVCASVQHPEAKVTIKVKAT